jgi:serine/threonine-protein kinase RsbW
MAKTMVIPSDLNEGRKLAEMLLCQARSCGYGEDVCFAISLAVEEALINAIKHGNRGDASKKVTVVADVGPELARIVVVDEGGGFDPSSVPDPTLDENLEKPSGRGIMLMRAYMDEVSFNRQGNAVTMIKRRPAEESKAES